MMGGYTSVHGLYFFHTRGWKYIRVKGWEWGLWSEVVERGRTTADGMGVDGHSGIKKSSGDAGECGQRNGMLSDVKR